MTTPQFIPLPTIIMLFPFFLLFTLSLFLTETERTLAIIKPDGVSGNHTDSVKETILNHGFKITEESFIQLDEDRVKSFYAEHSSRNFFPSLIEYMTSGPVLIMVLEKGNAIADWRTLIGPTDPLRAKVTHPHRSGFEPWKESLMLVLGRLSTSHPLENGPPFPHC
ncbi:probable nucleoside diphosphate kinase 5 isoform X4 [Capsicum annuum]|uniref:probable nucleoside diphosphate kinase 5 isoform X4 n=1 Tax=Capsicum annuum TaxID=4072 RepID=UPI001FB128B0|nr:probable nucleoside diphosphate kinase 5 isoform X4 [Capsicum annuum]